MRVLLTGAGGFIGAHVFEHLLANTSYEIIATDSFRHKGRVDRLTRILDEAPDPGWRRRVRVITHDLCAPFTTVEARKMGRVDLVIAMASESHVDRSLDDPVPFIRNNVDVVLNTLELCRWLAPSMVLVMSTDEVYGPVTPGGKLPEWSPILPSNPYAASKAAQEAIAISYWRAYALPVVLINCMNLFGEMQDAEKFLPMMIRKIASGETVPIHGRPGNIGSRHYLHARNLADAMLYVWQRLPATLYHPAATRDAAIQRPDRYNVASPDPVSNLALAEMVAEMIKEPLRYELVDFHTARPGHDPHYGLDSSKLTMQGWRPPVEFKASLKKTVAWSLKHPEWLEG